MKSSPPFHDNTYPLSRLPWFSRLIVVLLLNTPAVANAQRPPNFVIIFTDDQGYGDLSCFGGTHVSTPRIDQMAAEGSRLTSFYVAAPVCTPSRAALMTGCYPKRINMATGSDFGVLLAGDRKGLNPDEITIAEVLQTVGYKTGMFGKWHLGDQPEFLPTFAKLAGASIPTDRVIDGKDIWPTLIGEAKTPHAAFFYHGGNQLRAVRSENWKLHTNNKGVPTQLYNLENDIGEKQNVIKLHPDIVRRLNGHLKAFAKDIAANNRPSALVDHPQPLSK